MSTVTVPQRTTEIDEIRIPEPLWSVKSRVSWGALLAGTVIAVVTYSLLALLGVAIAMSLSDRLTAEQLGTMAGIWTFVTLLLSMFLGGLISTRFTVGEFRNEAILYGIIVWAVSSVVLIPLSMLGIGTSVGTVLASRGIAKINNDTVPMLVSAQEEFSKRFSRIEDQLAHVARRVENTAKQETSSDKNRSDSDKSDSDNNSSDRNSSDSASSSKRQDSSTAGNSDTAGSSKRDSKQEETSTSDSSNTSSSDDSQRVARRDNSNQDRSNQDRSQADDGNSKQTAREKAVSASWFAFGGTLLSMLSAVFGAIVGPTISIVHHKVPVRTIPPVTTRATM